MLDNNAHNNTRRTRGLLKAVEPLRLGAITRLDDGNQSQLGWLPVNGWNEQDRPHGRSRPAQHRVAVA